MEINLLIKNKNTSTLILELEFFKDLTRKTIYNINVILYIKETNRFHLIK